MGPRLRPRWPSHTTVVAYLALFLVIGGGAAVAAGQLGKNTVGAKQLKRNAVTTTKIKKAAITAAKVKAGTLTGAQINLATLGTVPSAQVAQVANSIVSPEGWHQVGAPGEPGFQSGYGNAPPSPPPTPETVAFLKDREGFVHLKGVAVNSTEEEIIFQLPAGYRPAAGKRVSFVVICNCGPSETGPLVVLGSGIGTPGLDGAVVLPKGSVAMLDGIAFRAES